jgi:hypothetical protein
LNLNKTTVFLTTFLLTTSDLLAQRGYEDYDEEDVRDFERYAHLNLSSFEWICIAVGIILLLIAKSIRDQNKKTSNVFGCLGAVAALPLLMVLLAVAQKAIGYVIILVLIVGGLYYLFGNKS